MKVVKMKKEENNKRVYCGNKPGEKQPLKK